MKKTILSLALLIISGLLLGQTQMRYWTLAGRFMEFNTSGPVVLSPLPQSVSGTCTNGVYNYTMDYSNCHNSIYDNNGNLLFFIVDGVVYSNNGDKIGDLFYGSNYFKGVDDYAIAKDPACDGKYYIFFSGEHVGQTLLNSMPYYAHVNLNANGQSCPGVGELTTFSNGTAEPIPNVGGAFDSHAASVQYAISKPINVNNERFVFVKSTLGFSRFKITYNNGIQYDNYTCIFPYGQGSSMARGETELVSLAGGGYRLACTYNISLMNNSNPAPYNNGNKIFIGDLDASGTITSYRVLDLLTTNQSDMLMPTGLEFSPDGNILYFTHTPYVSSSSFSSYAINYYDYSANSGIASLNTTGGSLYADSQIELAQDQKLYFTKGNQMASLSNTNTPSTSNWNANAFFFNFTYLKSTVGLAATSIKHIYILPDQIDGETYNNIGIDAINYTAPVQTTTWTNSSNPWGHTSPIRISGAFVIPTGANITIQDMIFDFAEGASLQIQNGATFKIDRSTLQSLPCGLMWLGIYIADGGKLYMGKYGNTSTNNSKIYDAMQAIDLYGTNAFLEVQDASLFDKNERHIKITNGNGALIKIQNNILRHQTALKDQSNGMPEPNGLINYGISSIEIINSGFGINNPIIIGNPTPNSTDINFMYKGQNGIIVQNSNVNVIHNTFSNIFNIGLFVDQFNNLNRTVSVTNFNTFDAGSNLNYMPYGIYAKNKSNMTILWNYFKNFQPGSIGVYLQNNNNCNLYTNYNNTNFNYNGGYFLKAYNNGGPSTVMQVEGNLVVMGPQSTAIDISETTLSASNTFAHISILSNNISGVVLGINLLNIKGLGHTPTVSSPGYNAASLVMSNNVAFTSVGIKTKTSPLINIAENTVTADNPGDWTKLGISVENSETTLVYKNHVSAGTGLVANGNMLNSNYYCNTFDQYVTGIKLLSHILRSSPNTHGDGLTGPTHFGRQNTFLNQASWGNTFELWGCNNSQNQWACFLHPLSSITFTVAYNGVVGNSNLVVFTSSCTMPDGCKTGSGGAMAPSTDNNEINNATDNSLIISPNPNNGQFTVSIISPQQNAPNLYITDFSGRILHTQPIYIQEGVTQIKMDKTDLPAGIYFIKIDGFNEALKMIITKSY
jgi:hypothetical protein